MNPKLYRLVDDHDVFSVIDSVMSFNNFLEHLNSQHPNIKFTLEEGIDSLPFLHTETDTGVILNSAAVCPQN